MSNSSFQYHPDNKTSNFKVHLSKEINLDGDWSVSLAEISYPNTFYNVSSTSPVVSVRFNEGFFDDQKMFHPVKWREFEIKMQVQFCHSLNDLTTTINKLFKSYFSTNLFGESLNSNGRVKINVKEDDIMTATKNQNETSMKFTNKIFEKLCVKRIDPEKMTLLQDQIFSSSNIEIILKNNLAHPDESPYYKTLSKDNELKLSSNVEIFLHGRLALQFGFLPEENILNYKTSPYPPSLDFGVPPETFVYIDIIYPQLISDHCSQVIKILKTVDKNTEFGEYVSREIVNRSYFPLNKLKFQTVSVQLRDCLGQLLPFQFGVSKLQVHFKRSHNNNNE